MPAARSAKYPAPASGPPSSTSMPSLSSLPHASSLPNGAGGSSADHGLHFIANHHRHHNLDDPKLRSSPIFKSRRSSLLGSVLNPKPKPLSRFASRSAAAAPPQPRMAGRPSHHHTQSLPASTGAIPRPRHDDGVGNPKVRDLGASQHQPSALQTPAQRAEIVPEVPDETASTASLFDIGDPLRTASLDSPVDMPEGSGSTCSSTHVKGFNFASMQAVPPSSASSASYDSAFAVHVASLSGRPHPHRAAIPEEDATVPEASVDEGNTCNASQRRTDLSEQFLQAPVSADAVQRTSSPLELNVLATTPTITRTHVPDDSGNAVTEVCPSPDLAADVDQDAQASLSPPYRASSTSALNVSISEPDSGSPMGRLPHSTSAPVISPRRFSSLSRRSATNLAIDTDLQSSLPTPRISARDITDELASPSSREPRSARADRRMSMLDFLAVDTSLGSSPHLTQTNISAEVLSRPAQRASSLRVKPGALAPASVPLIQASRQFRLEAAAAQVRTSAFERVDLCDHVRVSVQPLVDRLNMFGSMQSSSNYSLAGSVVLEIPKLNVTRLSSAAGLARDGSTVDNPSVYVESLNVRFIGYSVYVDATGRFNAIKLTETSQELLPPEGHTCLVELIETGAHSTSSGNAAAPTASNDGTDQNLKYETEFDLSVPGWLPASQRSRFGATFYCVQATAIVEGHAVLSALSDFDGRVNDVLFGRSSPLSPAESLESELREKSIATGLPSSKDGTLPTPATLSRSKTRKTWLNKTAKQLQLISPKKANTAEPDQSGSASNSRRGSASKGHVDISNRPDPVFSKTTEISNQLLPTGQHAIKSESLGILVRRCRDIVPVPVARLARLATASQLMRDAGTNLSLTQSMVALSGLQEEAVHNAGSQAPLQFPSNSTGGLHLPSSASLPASLAEHTTAPPSYPAGHQTASAAAVTSEEDQGLQLLAPSPRIGAHPSNFGSLPSTRNSEDEGIQNAPNESSPAVPPASSAFCAPRDPAKLAATSSALTASATLPNLPSSTSRASSLLDSRYGNANSPPRTSSRTILVGQSSAPLRHFVHRPILHLPSELGITPDVNAGGGLNFSLTLSLPSHVHVTGPTSHVLSFGVQIDVGRTEGWNALKQWGGLRLKDMEIVCLQTERHSSMPSRSFCATFPVPSAPNKVDAADLPIVTYASRPQAASSSLNDAQLAAERGSCQGYDRSLVLGHITLANQGKEPHPVENNVERIRTTIVGPPPIAPRDRQEGSGKSAEEAAGKGKGKSIARAPDRPDIPTRSPSHGSPLGSGSNTPDGISQGTGLSSLRAAFAPAAQLHTGSRTSVMQPLPRALTHSRNSSNASLRLAFQGNDSSVAMQPRPSSSGAAATGPVGRSRRPIPFDLSSAATSVSTSRHLPFTDVESDPVESSGPSSSNATNRPLQEDRQALAHALRSDSDESPRREGPEDGTHAPDSDATRIGLSSSVSTRASTASRTGTAPRRSRFETAMNRLSTFASSMLEQPTDVSIVGSGVDSRGSASASRAAQAAAASLRATYAFSGDDGQGVDLTKGRVRMTINLPLVSSDKDTTRKAGSAHLMSDFESPYVRIRHKLKVKLVFGLKSDVASGEDGEDWGQALVMCVPVRFTEAPPQEVQDQFGPVDVQAPSQNGSAAAEQRGAATAGVSSAEEVESSRSPSGLPVPFAEPLLPAYAQLFREDGSRLADEGEDLPRYPGRMSVVGEIEEDPAPANCADNGHGAEQRITSQMAGPASAPYEASALEAVAEASSSVHESRSDDHRHQGELSAAEITTLPRLSSLATVPMTMDRTTSLPGRRLLARNSSSGIYRLGSEQRQPASDDPIQRSISSTFTEFGSSADSQPRFGSPAFDPLPTRPGMRNRSSTTASLVSFSRIMPAEVLDEALVTSALDDEEDRMDGMQASDTLRSLNGPSLGGVEGMEESGPEDDVGEFYDEAEREEEIEDEAYEELDDVDSPGVNSEPSEAGHSATDHRLRPLRQRGEGEEGEMAEGEIGRAF